MAANTPPVLLVPPQVDVNDDFSFDVPITWENERKWRRRNDMQDIEEHNIGVQLSKTQLVQNAAGTAARFLIGRVYPWLSPRTRYHAGHVRVSPADLYVRVGMVQWTWWKAFQSTLLLVRVALNLFAAIQNFMTLPRPLPGTYLTTRRLTFGFELAVLCWYVFSCVATVLTAAYERWRMRATATRYRDPVPQTPWQYTYYHRRQQVCSCCGCCDRNRHGGHHDLPLRSL